MSATSDSMPLRYSSGSGRCQTGSPARSDAPRTWPTRSSLFPMSPAIWRPRATTQAPVSVATSTMASGAASAASDRPSASTRRPSASVLSTSIVLPLRIFNTSPGLTARPPGMFSVVGTMAITLAATARSASADMVASTAAAPLMSVFMVIIPSAVLIDSPPESKVMPLPTSATVGTCPSPTPGAGLEG